MSTMNTWWNRLWPPLGAVVLLLIIWQLATSLFHIETWILPSPALIGHEAWSEKDRLGLHTWATLKLTLSGFSIGVAFGLLVAGVLHYIPFLRSALYPLLILSQNIPTIALGPLLVIWFGFGILSKLIVIILVCFFPVTIAALSGLATTDRTMLNYMQMIGASKNQIFWKLELPFSLPSIFSGVKIAATYSVMGAIIAEWISSSEGIGYYMMLQKSAFRTDHMFLAILVVVVISLMLFMLINMIEKWCVRWHHPAQHRAVKGGSKDVAK
ncbi:ABC-type nitrate/sulfonate/bicarbonate transport system permease component [Paenibacillus sp. SORGH_AS306]|nr:ABC-type nitrate/sulfonate/bicarbonate transport system permease component [Paenibacillus sp. SORGH_AS_0306]MDR6109290.1 ABC-type nitrate/sulfonate/bicarbonate transport system permease component [Paenibacillus sp. SORGH_AS_0338]